MLLVLIFSPSHQFRSIYETSLVEKLANSVFKEIVFQISGFKILAFKMLQG